VRITDHGVVHGASGTTGGTTRWHAAVWNADGTPALLGELDTNGTSVARSLNSSGVAVGWATRDGQTRPVRWTPTG
jgi:hypothetical protein